MPMLLAPGMYIRIIYQYACRRIFPSACKLASFAFIHADVIWPRHVSFNFLGIYMFNHEEPRHAFSALFYVYMLNSLIRNLLDLIIGMQILFSPVNTCLMNKMPSQRNSKAACKPSNSWHIHAYILNRRFIKKGFVWQNHTKLPQSRTTQNRNNKNILPKQEQVKTQNSSGMALSSQQITCRV